MGNDAAATRGGRDRLRGLGWWALLGLLGLLHLHYRARLLPGQPGITSDALFFEQLTQAYLAGKVFGREIIFVYGPLQFLHSGHFHPATHAWTLLYQVVLALALCAGLVLLARRAGAGWALLLGLLYALPLPLHPTAPLFLLPALAVLLRAAKPAGGQWLWPLVVLLIGLSGHAKFSALLGALLVLPAADLALWWTRRERPLLTPALLAAVVAAQLLAGQPLAALPDFLLTSASMASDFSALTSLEPAGRWAVWERGAFLAAGAALLLLVLGGDRHRGLPRLVLAAAALPTLFMAWKASFVRHDGHALDAWMLLFCLSLLFAAAAARRRQRIGLLVAALLSMVAYFGASGLHGKEGTLAAGWRQAAGSWQRLLPAALFESTLPLLFDLPGHWRTWEAQRTTALAAIATDYALPPLHGRGEVVGWPSLLVTAPGLPLHARPAWGFASADPAVARANQAHFERADRPDFVLWRPLGYDRHYPSLDDASVWPALFAHYDLASVVKGYALLLPRQTPRPVAFEPLPAFELRFGQWHPQEEAGLLWTEIHVAPTPLGRLLALLWRPPLLWIDVRLESGALQTHRMTIQGAVGFLLSPHVPEVDAAARLFRSFDAPQPANRVAAFRLRQEEMTPGGLYQEAIRVQPYRLAVGNFVAPDLPPTLPPGDLLGWLEPDPGAPTPVHPARFDPQGLLLAHAPMTLVAPAEVLAEARTAAPLGLLEIGFGLRDGSWQAEQPGDGVCFQVLRRLAAEETLLWERCLDPARLAGDRGPQGASLPVPDEPGALLLFRTHERGGAAYDQSYWSRAQLR